MTQVFLQAQSCICALGDSAEAIRQGLFAARPSGVQVTDRYSPGKPLALGVVDAVLPTLSEAPTHQRSRTNALLAAALAPLRAQVDAVVAQVGAHRVAVVVGISTAGLDEGRIAAATWAQRQAWPAGFDFALQEMGNAAEYLAQSLGITGPAYAISTACSSGAKALATGARMLRAGLVDAVVAGGTDALSPFTIAGFSALEAVAAQRCNPLSVNRCGINIGEGAALFLMGRGDGPVRLSGWGESSDAHHMSAPEPSGRGAADAMRQALLRAGLQGRDIDYVNLHGTGTLHNDAMECLAVQATVGADCPVSSTKPLTGHALGAAGAIEAALAWHVLVDNSQGQLPPHWWDGQTDPALARVQPVPVGWQLGRPVRHVLSNSFAFGGSNAALVLSGS